jgi:hypothetical protein
MRVLASIVVVFLTLLSPVSAQERFTASDGVVYQIMPKPEDNVVLLNIGDTKKVGHVCNDAPGTFWSLVVTCTWTGTITATDAGVVETAEPGNETLSLLKPHKVMIAIVTTLMLLSVPLVYVSKNTQIAVVAPAVYIMISLVMSELVMAPTKFVLVAAVVLAGIALWCLLKSKRILFYSTALLNVALSCYILLNI